MNLEETFSKAVNSPADLALYAGVLIVVYILFQEKLEPVKNALVNFVKSTFNKLTEKKPPKAVPAPSIQESEDNFFQLVKYWKATRDLAEAEGCSEAVKILDSSFQYLSPQQCDMCNGDCPKNKNGGNE